MDSAIFASTREVEQFGGPVVRLYQTAFGRAPDGPGLRSFVALLRGGETVGGMAEQLVAAAEFAGIHGTGVPDLAYIRRLHTNATGDAPRDIDIAAILAMAAGGASRADLLAATSESEAARAGISVLRALGPDRVRPGDDDAYQLWLAEYPAITEADRAGIERHLAAMASPPALTLLMAAPEFRVDLALETIASFRRQLYPHVELRVAIPADTSPATRDGLTRAARETPGIVLVPAPAAEPASLIEAALAGADGCFAGILEAGDQLAPEALYLMAAAIEANPSAVIVYGDEDRIEGTGRRYAARLKTGWNPDLLLAGDAIGQLAMIRVESWRAAGGLRPDPAPYERFDLVLRVLGDGATAAHVPWVLFHRGRGGRKRPAEFPDASATTLHPRLLETIRRHLARHPSAATLDETIIGGRLWPRIGFALPDPAPLVSVIIPTRDRADLLETCLAGLLGQTDYPALEILIVDNGSVEPATRRLFAELGRDRRVSVLPYAEEFNYSAMNNMAARQARGDVLLMLNNDIRVIEPGWLREMVGHAMRPTVGAVGARLLYPEGNLQHGGIMLGPAGRASHILRWSGPDTIGYLGQLALTRDVAAVTGACLAIRRAVFEEVGGLEEDNLRVTWNDIDLCLRVRAHGYRVVWTPHATLTHVEQASRQREDQDPGQLARFQAERNHVLWAWGDAFAQDPFQNPALLATDDDLLLAEPPRRPKPWRES